MPAPIMQFFSWEHLPPHLQSISKAVAELAQTMDEGLPYNAEKMAGLRKLLEAKDCFVRATIAKPDSADVAAPRIKIDEPVKALKVVGLEAPENERRNITGSGGPPVENAEKREVPRHGPRTTLSGGTGWPGDSEG